MTPNDQATWHVGHNTDAELQELPLSEPAPAADQISVLAADPIMNPDEAYLANTTKIDISGLTFSASYDSISDGVLTVRFSDALQKLGPVPTSWQTWSSPPFSEDPNPDVLYSPQNSLTMELSREVSVFGFELEPGPFDEIEYTAEFFRGDTLVESVTRSINGFYGARLLAVEGGRIDRVVVTGGADFAIAQVRYELPLILMWLAVVLLLVLILALILL